MMEMMCLYGACELQAHTALIWEFLGRSRKPRSSEKQQLCSAFPMSRLGSWLLFVAQDWMLQITIPRTGRKMPAGSFSEASTRDCRIIESENSLEWEEQ